MALRPLVAAATAALIAPLALAHAGSLPVGGRSLGAGNASVPRCAPSGLTVAKVIDALTNALTAVTVSQIPAGCGGATIAVTVNNGSGYASKSDTVPPGGGSLTLVLPAPVALTASEQIDVVVAGP